MSRPVASAWIGVGAALAVQSVPAVAAASHDFTSPAGYALRYPAGWTRADASSGRLLILSRGKRVQGPVIGPDQAAILVRMLDGGETVPPAAARAALPAASGPCRTWRVLETSDASDPGPTEISRSLYCIGDARTVLVQLTHWAGDPRRTAYHRAAIEVAASLRFQTIRGPQHAATSDR